MGRRVLSGVLIRRQKITRVVPVGSIINCADNSGAKKLRIIQVIGYKGRLKRRPSACVGDHIKVSVYSGPYRLRKQVLDAVLVRQKFPIRRPDGTRVAFEDNAAVLITPEGNPMGTEIKGPIAKEAADLWSRIASMASLII